MPEAATDRALGVGMALAALASLAAAEVAGFVALPLAAVLAYRIAARGVVAAGVLVVAACFVTLEVAFGPSIDAWVPVALACWAPFALGYQVGVRRRLVAELAERAGELEAEEETFASLSVRRERARIARDLHDVVAHHLAVIVVQAGAGRIASAPTAARSHERFAAIGHAGDQALEDMAQLVDLIGRAGAPDADVTTRLRASVDQARAGGLDVRLEAELSGPGVPPEVADAAFRAVQEGLTNAMKHAPGATVAVFVSETEDWLEVTVHDDGSTQSSNLDDAGAGLGLPGMRERMEALGGRLDAGPTGPSGWALRAQLPLPERRPAAEGVAVRPDYPLGMTRG
jgi:signal transduction histidine kinase